MSNMKNNLYLLSLISFISIPLSFLFLAPPVHTAPFTAGDAASFATKANTQIGAEKEMDVNEMAARIAKGVFSTAGIIFFLLMFYGGYTWLMARGEEEQVKKAQNIIIAACIGLFIMVGSYAFTNFVLSRMISKTPSTPATDGGTEKPKGDLGCCLNEVQSPNSVMFDVLNPNDWLSDIMDYDACNTWCKTCDDKDDVCGSIEEGTHCLFYNGIDSPNTCWDVYAKKKNDE